MGLFSKLFGPSKLQEEFQKALALKWLLTVKNIQALEYSFNNSLVLNNFSGSVLVFDFYNSQLLMEGELVSDVFNMNSIFQIVKNKIEDSTLVFYLSEIDTNEISLTCTISRDYIQFDSTRRDWHAKLHEAKFQLYSSTSQG